MESTNDSVVECHHLLSSCFVGRLRGRPAGLRGRHGKLGVSYRCLIV